MPGVQGHGEHLVLFLKAFSYCLKGAEHLDLVAEVVCQLPLTLAEACASAFFCSFFLHTALLLS